MKLLLIDGNSMLFRGFYATCYGNILKTSDGIYTNAVFAFSNMIFKAIDKLEPTHCAVAFDKGKHTFRHELADDYKAGRAKTPDELVGQFSLVREFLSSASIPYFEYDDIEGDDIIGSLSKMYPGVETVILTSDKDLLQLIDDSTTVYLMTKGISEMSEMNEKSLLEVFGVEPLQIIELKALMGDSSDNIKGVKGIGQKTAVKLLNEYHDCDGIYKHIDEVKGKLKENLINDKDSCYLSKQLATIKTDVKIPVAIDDMALKINENNLNAFYDHYEMISLKRNNHIRQESFKEVREVNQLSSHFFNGNPFIYFDCDGFSYYKPKLYGLCIADDLGCEYISFDNLLKDEQALAFLASSKEKTLYDYKAALHLAEYNHFVVKDFQDLMLMAFLTNNYLINLDEAFKYYGLKPIMPIGDIYGNGKKDIVPDHNLQLERASKLTQQAFIIKNKLLKEMKEKDVYKLYKEVELPLSEVLYAMEKEGISCDINILSNIAYETKEKMDDAAKEIYSYANAPFNLNSPKQLASFLYDELGLPTDKKRSTSAEILENLVNIHPVIETILEYRKQSKLYSTYAEGLQKYISEDGKIHTIFSQTNTQTGRLSSSEPNLQNISVRDEDGRAIRKAFNAQEGYVFMDSDYSQVELRVLASMAHEEKMIEAFNNHVDIHTSTAAHIFHKTSEEVTSLDRRKAKAVNFGVVYGISDFGLAKQIGVSRKEAKEFIDNYYQTYPNIASFMEKQIAFCEEHGYVLTLMNRRRYIHEIKDHNYMTREFGKRAAMNAPVQGTAADIMKVAMVNCYKLIKEKNLKSKMLLQIHDELLFEVPNDEIEIMKEVIKEGMGKAFKLDVELESSLGLSSSWYEAK